MKLTMFTTNLMYQFLKRYHLLDAFNFFKHLRIWYVNGRKAFFNLINVGMSKGKKTKVRNLDKACVSQFPFVK